MSTPSMGEFLLPDPSLGFYDDYSRKCYRLGLNIPKFDQLS